MFVPRLGWDLTGMEEAIKTAQNSFKELVSKSIRLQTNQSLAMH